MSKKHVAHETSKWVQLCQLGTWDGITAHWGTYDGGPALRVQYEPGDQGVVWGHQCFPLHQFGVHGSRRLIMAPAVEDAACIPYRDAILEFMDEYPEYGIDDFGQGDDWDLDHPSDEEED